MQVVIHGMEHEVESTFFRILFLLKLLTSVLLITQKEFQVAVAQKPGIIQHSLVMMNLLIRHRFAIALHIVAVGHFQLSRFLISFSLHDARSEMIIIECEVRMPHSVVPAEKLRESLLSERRTEYVTIVFVLVGMRHLAAVSGVPNESALVAGKVERIVKKSVVGLIARREIRSHVALGKCRSRVEDQDASHRIRAIHEACRTFQNLYGMNRSRVDFYSVFIAPLLTFLSDSIVHHNHAVIAQATDYGL